MDIRPISIPRRGVNIFCHGHAPQTFLWLLGLSVILIHQTLLRRVSKGYQACRLLHAGEPRFWPRSLTSPTNPYLLFTSPVPDIFYVSVFRHYGWCPWILRSQCTGELGQSFCMVPVRAISSMTCHDWLTGVLRDVNPSLSTASDYLLPWYLNYLGGSWPDATQCITAGDNGWNDNHAALNGDLNNKWALNNTPWSWGHFRRSDIPVHFGVAEGWTVADMYQVKRSSPLKVAKSSLMFIRTGICNCFYRS